MSGRSIVTPAVGPSFGTPGCTITWVGGTGSWTTASNWDKNRVPGATDDVCIKAAGSTVTLSATAATVDALTLGGTSGATVTLFVQGVGCTANASLATTSTTNADVVAKTGVLDLTSTTCSGSPASVSTASVLNVGGALRSDPGAGATRTISGAVTNTGVVAINTATDYTAGSTFENTGALNLADGVTFTLDSPGTTATTFADDAGGSVVSSGSSQTGQLAVDGGNTYRQGAGTTSGEPVLVNPNNGAAATISYTGTGASALVAQGADTVTGSAMGASQSLTVEGVGCGFNAATTFASSMTSAGQIYLTTVVCSGSPTSLSVASGQVLTLSGSSAKLEVDPGAGNTRTLSGSITNTSGAVVAIDANTDYAAGATFDNKAALDLADGVTFTLDSPGTTATTFADDAGGSVVSSGSSQTGQLAVDGGNTYRQGAGTTSGEPVLVNPNNGAAATISYTGTGASALVAQGADTVTGSAMGASQSLTVEGVGCGFNAATTFASSMTSAGQIYLTTVVCSGSPTSLSVASGQVLTLSGSSAKLEVDPGAGNSRSLSGSIVTTGSASTVIDANTDIVGGTFNNGAALTVADSTSLTLDASAAATFIDGAGGSVTTTGDGSTGALRVAAGNTYNQGAGTTAGGPVYVDDSTLLYTGTGASTVDVEGTGTETGNIAAGQNLTLLGIGCGEAATETSTASFTNAGVIDLTTSVCSGSPVTLNVGLTGKKANKLTNTGTIQVDPGVGGTRTIQGSITNNASGRVIVNATATYTPSETIPGGKKPKVIAAPFDNKGSIALNGVTLTVTGVKKATLTDDKGGAITTTGSGQLVVDGPTTYTQGKGTTSGNPVLVSGGILNLSSGGGAASIDAEGSVTLKGTVNAGQTLTLLAVGCGPAVTATDASALTVNGALVLTAVVCSGTSSTLTLSGSGSAGTVTIGSTGSITWPEGAGGTRTINATIVNNGTMGPSSIATLTLNGNYTQGSAGKYDVSVNSPNSADSIHVSGTATLAGTMTAVPVSGFTPTAGNSWTGVLTASTVSGTFGTVNGPGGSWSGTYSPTSVGLVYNG